MNWFIGQCCILIFTTQYNNLLNKISTCNVFPNLCSLLVIYEKDSQLAKMQGCNLQGIRPFKPNSAMPIEQSTNDNVVCMIEDFTENLHSLGYICIKLLKINNGKYILQTITFLQELCQDFNTYIYLSFTRTNSCFICHFALCCGRNYQRKERKIFIQINVQNLI